MRSTLWAVMLVSILYIFLFMVCFPFLLVPSVPECGAGGFVIGFESVAIRFFETGSPGR